MNARVAKTDRSEGTSRADGGITAELRLIQESLLCAPTIRRVPDISIEPDYTTTAPSGRPITYLTVFGGTFDAFESALETDNTVTDPVLYNRYPDRRVYRVTLSDSVIQFTPTATSVEGRILRARSSRDGWTVTLRFPSRDALVAFNERCRERDIQVTVNNLRASDDGEDRILPLTQKQEELLTVAYEEGYFAIPRGISQDELAAKIGVSRSAVSQRLRRAMAGLCGASISTTK